MDKRLADRLTNPIDLTISDNNTSCSRVYMVQRSRMKMLQRRIQILLFASYSDETNIPGRSIIDYSIPMRTRDQCGMLKYIIRRKMKF